MFVGSIQHRLRQFFAGRAVDFAGRDVVVGCSGNFSFETVLGKYAEARAVYSNDVSFYTCALGRWLVGKPVDFSITAEYAWLQPYCETADDAAAMVVTLSRMLRYMTGKPNLHKERMLRGAVAQFARVHDETKRKLAAVRDYLHITGFYAGDALEHYAQHGDNDNALFVAYAPTYKGGYEKMWAKYADICTWTPPNYALLDDERRADMLAWLRERDFIWIDDRELEDLTPLFAQQTSRLRTSYVYSNCLSAGGHVARHVQVRDPQLELVDTITADSVLSVLPVKQEVFAFYRENYLAKSITPAAGQWALLVLVDGKAAGALNFASHQLRMFGDYVYMLSDFVIGGTPYKRLSKLVVMAATSREVGAYLERQRVLPTRCFSTTAFTDKPVSMKYRGVLDLTKRGAGMLQYEGVFGQQSLGELFAKWWQKYGNCLRS